MMDMQNTICAYIFMLFMKIYLCSLFLFVYFGVNQTFDHEFNFPAFFPYHEVIRFQSLYKGVSG